jgi:hypothetical protein
MTSVNSAIVAIGWRKGEATTTVRHAQRGEHDIAIDNDASQIAILRSAAAFPPAHHLH